MFTSFIIINDVNRQQKAAHTHTTKILIKPQKYIVMEMVCLHACRFTTEYMIAIHEGKRAA